MTSSIFSYTFEGEPFRLFSLPHLAVLALCLAVSALLYLFRHRLRISPYGRWVRLLLAALLIATEVSFQLWHMVTASWSAAYSLPLQLCSVSLLFSACMLLTRSHRLFEITFFPGLAGAGLAMLTPELFYPFPHFRFLHFFLAHAAILWACLYMVWVEQYRLSIRSVWKSIGFLNLLLCIALWVNAETGGNYLFVSHKPSNPSPLDYLGPYPWYLLSLEGVAILLFHVLYLLFARKKLAHSVPTTGQEVSK